MYTFLMRFLLSELMVHESQTALKSGGLILGLPIRFTFVTEFFDEQKRGGANCLIVYVEVEI